jgi:hypothetical protein
MQAHILPSGRGWRWLADGYGLFRRNPLMFGLLILGYWILMMLINGLPLLGPFVAPLCIPGFAVSFMNGCRDLDAGQPLTPQHLFSGFRHHPRRLVALGAVYLAATLAILGISALLDGGGLLRMMLIGDRPDAALLSSGDFSAAVFTALLLMVPLAMAYWFAPVLAGWHDLPVGKALFFSFFACLRNWRAFLVFGASLTFVGALLPGIVLGLVGAIFPQGGDFLARLLSVPLLLILAPTLFASFYACYRDVFGGIRDTA